MQTSSLIALIKREAPEWSNGEIRELISDVQLIMYGKPLETQRMYDTTTGLPPVLTTSAGTYEYEISTGGGFDDNALFVEYISSTTDPETAYNYKEDREEFGENVYSIPGVRGTAAKVCFKEDPGANDFYVHAFKKPSSISMQYTNLSMPEHWHLTGVRVGVIGIIELVEHGVSRNWNTFLADVIPNFQYEQNKTADTFGYLRGSRGF